MMPLIALLLGLFSVTAVLFVAGLFLAVGNAWPRRQAAATEPREAAPVQVLLEGHGALTHEPGVLLNTLWEHLPNVDCQRGECGGCKVKLLSGEVRWIRDASYAIDKSSEFLACSCEAAPGTTLRCAISS